MCVYFQSQGDKDTEKKLNLQKCGSIPFKSITSRLSSLLLTSFFVTCLDDDDILALRQSLQLLLLLVIRDPGDILELFFEFVVKLKDRCERNRLGITTNSATLKFTETLI